MNKETLGNPKKQTMLLCSIILPLAIFTSQCAVAFAPATESDALTKAKQFNMYCNEELPPEVEKFTIEFNYPEEPATAPKHQTSYFIVSCAVGAYNSNSVLLVDDASEGLKAVSLALPLVQEKTKKIIGWIADVVLPGMGYDPKTKTITSFAKGRGIGDLSQRATYIFVDGQIVLREFASDTTPDGKFNPRVIYKSTVPAVR